MDLASFEYFKTKSIAFKKKCIFSPFPICDKWLIVMCGVFVNDSVHGCNKNLSHRAAPQVYCSKFINHYELSDFHLTPHKRNLIFFSVNRKRLSAHYHSRHSFAFFLFSLFKYGPLRGCIFIEINETKFIAVAMLFYQLGTHFLTTFYSDQRTNNVDLFLSV